MHEESGNLGKNVISLNYIGNLLAALTPSPSRARLARRIAGL